MSVPASRRRRGTLIALAAIATPFALYWYITTHSPRAHLAEQFRADRYVKSAEWRDDVLVVRTTERGSPPAELVARACQRARGLNVRGHFYVRFVDADVRDREAVLASDPCS